MFCENCGSQLPEGAKFCLNCGAKAEAAETADTAVQEAAAATDTVEVDAMTDVEDVSASAETAPVDMPDQQPAVQPGPVKPEPQPTPQPVQAKSAPQPAPRQVPPAQSYQQPAPPMEQPAVLKKPEKVNPIPVWKFIGIILLQGIPVIGLIMILVWSFGGSFNRNTRNYARAVLVLGLIGLALSIAFAIVNWAFISYVWESIGSIGGFGG